MKHKQNSLVKSRCPLAFQHENGFRLLSFLQTAGGLTATSNRFWCAKRSMSIDFLPNKRHVVCMKPRRPPMTNALALRAPNSWWHRNSFHTSLDDTSRSLRPFARIFKKVNISWGQRSVDAITGSHGPKRSILWGQSSPRNYSGGFRSSPPTTCRLSTRKSFDPHLTYGGSA